MNNIVNKGFVVSKNTEVKPADATALAYDSYCAYEEDEETTKAQLEAGRKCMSLYKALKGSIPTELQNLLFALDNAYGEQLSLATQQYYVSGFKNALESLNAVDGSVNSNDKH